MSLEAVQGFINKVNRDVVLGAMVAKAFANEADLDLVGLAEQHGFTFTREEGLEVWNTMQASDELPDVLLEAVAGGNVTDCVGNK